MTARGTVAGAIGARTFIPTPSSAIRARAFQSAMNCTSGLSMSARRAAWVASAWKSTGAKNTGGRRLRLLGDDLKVAAELAYDRYAQNRVVHNPRHSISQRPTGKQAR